MQIMSIIATNKKSCQPSSSVGAAATRSAGESINTDRPQTDSDTDTGVWSHKKRKALWQEWAVCGALCRIFCLHLWQQQQARRRIPVALTVLQFLLQLIFIAIAVHAASCCNIMVLARYLSKLAAQPNGRQASKQTFFAPCCCCHVRVITVFPSFIFVSLSVFTFIYLLLLFVCFYSPFWQSHSQLQAAVAWHPRLRLRRHHEKPVPHMLRSFCWPLAHLWPPRVPTWPCGTMCNIHKYLLLLFSALPVYAFVKLFIVIYWN